MTTECLECGETVTRQFARVFGDNNDRVHACLQCSNARQIQKGAAAGETAEAII